MPAPVFEPHPIELLQSRCTDYANPLTLYMPTFQNITTHLRISVLENNKVLISLLGISLIAENSIHSILRLIESNYENRIMRLYL